MMIDFAHLLIGVFGLLFAIIGIVVAVLADRDKLFPRSNNGEESDEGEGEDDDNRSYVWESLLAGIMFILGAGIIGAQILAYMYLHSEPNSIIVTTSRPLGGTVGDVFNLEITVENTSDKTVKLTDIALDENLLDGVEIQNITFYYIESDCDTEWRLTLSTYKRCHYRIDEDLLPGEILVGAFELRATKAGIYTGDVRVRTKTSILGIDIPEGENSGGAFRLDDRAKAKAVKFEIVDATQ